MCLVEIRHRILLITTVGGVTYRSSTFRSEQENKLSVRYYCDRLTALLKKDSNVGLQTLSGFAYRKKCNRRYSYGS
jgi:hypothetical protein